MMPKQNINRIEVEGCLIKDPDLKTDRNNIHALLFTIVNSRMVGFGEARKEIKSYVDCFARSGIAEYIARSFKKGDTILVMGHLQERAWVGESGNKTGMEVVVRTARKMSE